jgi:CheY-like chemotaxis protein
VALILVVDDEFSVAEVLQSVLADAGHEVVTAVNGRQGLELLGQRRPDLVLLDFMMPIMDGPALLKAMKQDPPCRNLPAVVMSSLPESTVAEAARGMYTAFLRKPFKLTAVTNTVKTVLGRQKLGTRRVGSTAFWSPDGPNRPYLPRHTECFCRGNTLACALDGAGAPSGDTHC